MEFLIQIMMDKLKPEIIHIFRPDKGVIINLTQQQENVIYNFKTKFFITKDGDIFNTEYTCGELDFSFVLNFKKNTYKFLKFKCKYDVDICYQQEDGLVNLRNINEPVAEVNNAATDSSKYFKIRNSNRIRSWRYYSNSIFIRSIRWKK